MSLDHDLQNLPRLTDADREALDDDYSVMPRLVTDEAIARRDATYDARLGNCITVSLLLNLAADLLNEADEANHSGHPITEALQRQAREVLAEAIDQHERD